MRPTYQQIITLQCVEAINKKPHECGANANGMFYPKQTTLTKQPIKKGILLLSILDTVVKFYPKVFS